MAKSDGATEGGVNLKPNILDRMTWDEIKARAQRIVDERGFPPYLNNQRQFEGLGEGRYPFEWLSDDELAVLSEFVYFWQPYLTLKEKPSGS